jgi:hypothetical protein
MSGIHLESNGLRVSGLVSRPRWRRVSTRLSTIMLLSIAVTACQDDSYNNDGERSRPGTASTIETPPSPADPSKEGTRSAATEEMPAPVGAAGEPSAPGAGDPQSRPGHRTIAEQKATSVEYQRHQRQGLERRQRYRQTVIGLKDLTLAVTGDGETNLRQVRATLRERSAPAEVMDALESYIRDAENSTESPAEAMSRCQRTLQEMEEFFPGIRSLLELAPPLLPCVGTLKQRNLAQVRNATICFIQYGDDVCLEGLNEKQQRLARSLLNGEEVGHAAL